jgi:hypothetical protein
MKAWKAGSKAQLEAEENANDTAAAATTAMRFFMPDTRLRVSPAQVSAY